MILQKRNAGFHTNSACFWDAARDGASRSLSSARLMRACSLDCVDCVTVALTGSVAIRWENATMTCVLTVYCISLQ